MQFEAEQLTRYSRNILLGDVGLLGQTRLRSARVLIVGVGGLGCPAAQYLAAAGIGTLGLVDDDCVELSNLQRQVLHTTPDIGRPKVVSAAEKLTALNPYCNIVQHSLRITAANAMDLLKDYDVVVDGADNFVTKFLVNDACVLSGKPLVHAGVLCFTGQVTTILPGQGPCYRCLFPEHPGDVPSCAQAGILGAVAGILGSCQSVEVIKVVLGIGEPLVGRMFVLDTLAMTCRVVPFTRDPQCPLCGEHPQIQSLQEQSNDPSACRPVC